MASIAIRMVHCLRTKADAEEVYVDVIVGYNQMI